MPVAQSTERATTRKEREREKKHAEEKISNMSQNIADLVRVLAGMQRDKEAEEARLEKITAQLEEAKFAAAAEVFGTVELLENILLHAPVKDVVRALQINSSFKATVMGSLRLRQHIFIDPKPVDQVLEWDYLRHYPTMSKYRIVHGTDQPRGPNTGRVNMVSLHPALQAIDCPSNWSLGLGCDSLNSRQKSHAGMWRNMLITNPPCYRASVGGRAVKVSTGVTLGNLADALQKPPLLERWKDSVYALDCTSIVPQFALDEMDTSAGEKTG